MPEAVTSKFWAPLADTVKRLDVFQHAFLVGNAKVSLSDHVLIDFGQVSREGACSWDIAPVA